MQAGLSTHCRSRVIMRVCAHIIICRTNSNSVSFLSFSATRGGSSDCLKPWPTRDLNRLSRTIRSQSQAQSQSQTHIDQLPTLHPLALRKKLSAVLWRMSMIVGPQCGLTSSVSTSATPHRTLSVCQCSTSWLQGGAGSRGEAAEVCQEAHKEAECSKRVKPHCTCWTL